MNGELFLGNNLDIMKNIISKYRHSVDLIYIDPPFETGRNFKKGGKL